MSKTVETLVEELRARKLTIVAMESCTGGAFIDAVTDVPGASEVTKGSFVTYSNEAKFALGVSPETIRRHTVYSPETALEMSRNAMFRGVGEPWIGVGITGSLNRIDPSNPEKSEPGVVHFAISTRFIYVPEKAYTVRTTSPDRKACKDEVVEAVAKALLAMLKKSEE